MQSFRVAVVLAIFLSTVSPLKASAIGSKILISELMTGSTESALHEFIELYNPNDNPIDLDGWSVDYKSSSSADTSSNWNRKASLKGIIPAHGFYLIAQKVYLDSADAEWLPSMASTSGHIRINNQQGTVVDKIGYGSSANAAEVSPSAAPAGGQSLERLPGKLQELSGNTTDTDDNSKDFLVRQKPYPQNSNSAIENAELVIEEVSQDSEPVFAIELSELLPNPISPLIDTKDEFIELYNPNDIEVILDGYQLLSGSNYGTEYTFENERIQPKTYKVFTAAQVKMSLPNGGGAVKLLDSAGSLIDETSRYDEAEDGFSWSKTDSGWEWSLKTSPGEANSIVSALEPSVLLPATTLAKAKVTKTKTTKSTVKKSSAKPKAPKKASAAKIKAKTSSAVKVAGAKVRSAQWLILTLIALTIAYALYEFRHDIKNNYYKLLRNRKTRPVAVTTDKGGRDD